MSTPSAPVPTVGDLGEALAVGEDRLGRFLQQTSLDLVLVYASTRRAKTS
jgi:hypothetical protein